MLVPCWICKKTFEKEHRREFMELVPDVCSAKCFKLFVAMSKPGYTVEVNFPRIRVFDATDGEMRSEYEKRFSKFLIEQKIEFVYEPFMFQLMGGKKRYVPDFYVPDRMFFEVKGLWQEGAKLKVRKFIEEYPYPLYLIDKGVLKILTKK